MLTQLISGASDPKSLYVFRLEKCAFTNELVAGLVKEDATHPPVLDDWVDALGVFEVDAPCISR
jgi:hypothetical protein